MRPDVFQGREAAVLLRGLRVAIDAGPLRHFRIRPARWQAVRSARRSVGTVIGCRQAAIQQRQVIASGACHSTVLRRLHHVHRLPSLEV